MRTRSAAGDGEAGGRGQDRTQEAGGRTGAGWLAADALPPATCYLLPAPCSQYSRYLARSSRQRASAALHDAAIDPGSSPNLIRAIVSFAPSRRTASPTSYFDGYSF